MKIRLSMLVAAPLLAVWPIAAAEYQAQLSDPPGKAVFEKICGNCHETKDVIARRRTRTAWAQVVEDMVARGAEGSADDMAAVVAYLSSQFGRTNVNAATAEEIVKSLSLSTKEAQAIVAYREKNGKIQDFDQLLKVPGIDGDKIREKRSWIAFAP
jgi:competence ComEA-like helix-hairpin-helix protein